MAKAAFAISAHPDDIEFMMLGTLLRLKDLGYEIHYMTIANGSLGSCEYSRTELARIRREEAMAAAKAAGAVFHESLVDDLDVYYERETLARLLPVMREVDPEIVLTHGPYDYMEDHVNAGRLAVSAAFCRGMKNFKCAESEIRLGNCAVYHSLPLSLVDTLNHPLIPDYFVDITDKIPQKRTCLNCHRSQKEWLDVSQGFDAYLDTMVERGEIIGKLSGFCRYAEGWYRHNPCGLCADDFNPLAQIMRTAGGGEVK